MEDKLNREYSLFRIKDLPTMNIIAEYETLQPAFDEVEKLENEAEKREKERKEHDEAWNKLKENPIFKISNFITDDIEDYLIYDRDGENNKIVFIIDEIKKSLDVKEKITKKIMKEIVEELKNFIVFDKIKKIEIENFNLKITLK